MISDLIGFTRNLFHSLLFGIIIYPSLKVERYPDIAPPSVRLELSYPGASAETLINSVAQVVEQQMTGLDNLIYFSTQATSEGNLTFSFSFEQGTNADIAQMQIQNRLDSIMSRLPETVQDNGASLRKVSDDTLQRIAFYCTNGTLKQDDIADFITSVISDPISRINGIGSVSIQGSSYAIRVWLDHEKLFHYKLTPQDIVNAISAQNKQIAVGQLGGLPSVENQPINVTIQSRKMFESLDQFNDILVYVDEKGAKVKLSDLARIEMGSQSYMLFGSYNRYPMASLSIDLSAGANAVEVSMLVDEMLKRFKPLFPDGLSYAIPYDTVPFIVASLHEVFKTLIEALILVALVIFLFLRDIRSTIVVSITIPIVIAGSLIILYLLGYSINSLTLFAFVLAIGLLVDDAIVVVENINRLIYTENLNVYDAAVKSMKEISSALFGVCIVIAAVFIPMSFFGGATGNIYRQFSVTIVSAMILSMIVAIVITPSLCAQILKVNKQKNKSSGSKRGCLDIFDSVFKVLEQKYLYIVGTCLKYKFYVAIIFFGFIFSGYGLYKLIPSSFLPVEDQGMMTVRIILPVGSTMQQTQKVSDEVQDYFFTYEKENLEGILMILGDGGGATRGQATAQAIVRLKDWKLRENIEDSAQAIINRAKDYFANFGDAKINIFLPPTVRGMGASTGFSVYVLNVMGNEQSVLLDDVKNIVDLANQSEVLTNVRYEVLDSTPQLIINVHDDLASQYLLNLDEINNNLEIAFGGKYVNDFVDRGRLKRVYVQSEAKYRATPESFATLYFKNKNGDMVNFNEIASFSWDFGPTQLSRFNGVSGILISGNPNEGYSSGQAMDEIAKIITSHSGNYDYAWTGISYQEKVSSSNTGFLFAISALVVFLCLAALYESWSIPIAVLLIVPIGIVGSLVAVWVRDMPNDVYLQVGLLTTGGLAAKNAVLLVEFAHDFVKRGAGLTYAAKMAAKMRFRPIVMTSVAFLLGVLPLMFASGAGSVSQRSIGTGVIGGTLAATFIGILFVPSFFQIVNILFNSRLRQKLHKKKCK